MGLKAARFVVFKSDDKNPINANTNTAKNPVAYRDYHAEVPAQFYWHLEAKNGKLIACGGEGFKTKRACLKSVGEVQCADGYTEIVIAGETK